MDLHQLVGWLLLTGLFIGLPLLTRPSVRRFVGPPMIRLGSWTVERLRPRDEPDEEADELSKVLRREQLGAEVQRLRRILATDASMSATRQIANRLAYRQLLRELGNTPDVYAAMPNQLTATRWDTSTLSPRTRRSHDAPTVEILEIGWGRHRTTRFRTPAGAATRNRT